MGYIFVSLISLRYIAVTTAPAAGATAQPTGDHM